MKKTKCNDNESLPQYRCSYCERLFRFSPEEERMEDTKLEPFCSEECYARSHGVRIGQSVRKVLDFVDRHGGMHYILLWHDGPAPDADTMQRRVDYVRPYTAEDKDRAFRMRGRGTFSDNCTVCVLPSETFYRKRQRYATQEEIMKMRRKVNERRRKEKQG